MQQNGKVYVFKTEVPGIEVSGVITDLGALYFQIRDIRINDSLFSEYFDSPIGALSESFVESQLEQLANTINDTTFKNLFINYLFKKYKFYVEKGWVSNMEEFQIKFLKEIENDEKEMVEHV